MPNSYGYCTNTFAALDLEQLRTVTLPAASRIGSRHPDATLDLQLGHVAIDELNDKHSGAAFVDALEAGKLRITSLNVFPLGDFQAPVVKEDVYRPDWWNVERHRLTQVAARWVARDLQPDRSFVLSTLPGRFHGEERPDRETFRSLAREIEKAATAFARLSDESGCRFILALEPEPFTTLESIADVGRLWAELSGDACRNHLGVNLDCCHFSVMGESPLEALEAFLAAGIAVPKIHVSTALSVDDPHRNRDLLRSLDEPRYLHQTVLHGGGATQRFADLGPAIDALSPETERATCHFHLPLFLDDAITTGKDTRAVIDHVLTADLDCGLYAETYTWAVSGDRWAPDAVAGIGAELDWLESKIKGIE